MSNTQHVDDYESSSSEDEGNFGFWGAGGSSGRLSECMAKREKDSKKDMQKEIAAKREAESHKPELTRSDTARAELIRLDAAKIKAERSVGSQGSQTLSSNSVSSQSNLKMAPANSATYAQGTNARSLADLNPISAHLSREQVNVDNSAAFNNAMVAAYVAQAMTGVASVPLTNRVVPRDEFETEPELLDTIPASKVLRRLGAYRNWSEAEIQSDLNALEFHRLRTVKDLRELSYDSWKELKELLPLVKELLMKEINRGRPQFYARPEIPLPNGAFPMADAHTDLKSVRAPTSTPMDSPDVGQIRRNFQGRQW